MSTTIDAPAAERSDRASSLTTVPIECRERISKEEVLREYLGGAGKPLIVTDAMDHWPARTKWRFGFFRDHYGDDIVVASDCIKRPTVKRRLRLRSFLQYVASPTTHPLAELNPQTPFYVYGYKPFRDHP